jgi:citrate synthase
MPTSKKEHMSKEAKLELDGKIYPLPTVEGSEGEKAVDISSLRANTGYITLDDGYGNTGSCVSKITFIDGDKGILRYRGIPIEDLAEKSNFIETAYLIIYGDLPSRAQFKRFSDLLTDNQFLHEDMKFHFEGFPTGAHPMAILSAMINAASCFDERLMSWKWGETRDFDLYVARLISQVRTIAAYSYRKSRGLPLIYPKKAYKYTANFLHMLFSTPYEDFELKPEVVRALDLIFLLHADHEQNCSTSTVRMVASSQANLFASCAAGVCALWGPLHGGANQAVIEMLEAIHREGDDGSKFIAAAKDKNSGKRLMGFGHRVYKNYDPRAKIIKKACDDVLSKLNINDPLLDIAKHLEAAALKDPYFIERGFLQRHHHARARHPGGDVHRDFWDWADARLDCELQGNHGGVEKPHLSAAADLHRAHAQPLRAHRGTQVNAEQIGVGFLILASRFEGNIA